MSMVVEWSPSIARRPFHTGGRVSPGAGEIEGEVIRDASRGDHAAFTALVDHYHPRLRVLAHQLLRDRELMDDVLQDVWLNAFRSLASFRHKSTLSTWLYRITYTTCLQQLRRKRPVMDATIDPEAIASRASDPSDRAATAGDLAAALAALPAEQCAAILLVYREGLSYEETAAVLGIPSGTVGSRLSVARGALRKTLGWGPEQEEP